MWSLQCNQITFQPLPFNFTCATPSELPFLSWSANRQLSYPSLPADLALERAMFSCILRPLRSRLEKALMALHDQDGSTQRLTQNMLCLKGEAAMERLGVRTGVPDGRGVERVKQKLILMQRTHSPIDKVLLLLQVCKLVHKAMGTLHGETAARSEGYKYHIHVALDIVGFTFYFLCIGSKFIVCFRCSFGIWIK